MIPNLIGAMSTSPVLINSLVGLFGKVHGGNFTEAQVQIALLRIRLAPIRACAFSPLMSKTSTTLRVLAHKALARAQAAG